MGKSRRPRRPQDLAKALCELKQLRAELVKAEAEAARRSDDPVKETAITGASAIHELQRTPRCRANLGGIQRRTALNPAAKACSFARSERFEQRGRRTAPQRPSASTSDFNFSLDGFHTTLACRSREMATSLGRIPASVLRPLTGAIVVSPDARWNVHLENASAQFSSRWACPLAVRCVDHPKVFTNEEATERRRSRRPALCQPQARSRRQGSAPFDILGE